MGTKIAGMITLYFSYLKVKGSFLCQNYCIDFSLIFSLCCVWIFEFFVNIWIYAMVKMCYPTAWKKNLSFSLQDWLTDLVRASDFLFLNLDLICVVWKLLFLTSFWTSNFTERWYWKSACVLPAAGKEELTSAWPGRTNWTIMHGLICRLWLLRALDNELPSCWRHLCAHGSGTITASWSLRATKKDKCVAEVGTSSAHSSDPALNKAELRNLLNWEHVISGYYNHHPSLKASLACL
jgi:hypothetical protein